MNKKKLILLLAFLFTLMTMASCSPSSPASVQEQSEGKLNIVATTSIVGDVVSQVGGDNIHLSVLLPAGSDPHSFDPTPQDIAKAAGADLIFANGAGLETFLENLIESAGAQDSVVYVSSGIDFLIIGEDEQNDKLEGDDHQQTPNTADPHTWTDPNNILVWIRNIEGKLSEADPNNSAEYAANAARFEAEIKALDAWVREQTAQIAPEDRKLVSDHSMFNYFADEYGFEQVGALIPGYSSLAEPSAQELAVIEDAISKFNVKAVFVGNTVNPALAERAAEDSGVALVYLYTGSLSEPGGEADTYLQYIRYNVSAIVDALK